MREEKIALHMHFSARKFGKLMGGGKFVAIKLYGLKNS
jgi:hypothetical protein